MTQNDFKMISQQIVAQVEKETGKLETDKQRLAAALRKSEQECASVSATSYMIYASHV